MRGRRKVGFGAAALLAVGGFLLRDVIWEEFNYAISEKTVVLGVRDERFLIATRNLRAVLDCDPDREFLSQPTLRQMLSDRACGDLKVVVFDAAHMPFVTRNIAEAWRDHHKAVLTADSGSEQASHDQVCPETFRRLHGGACTAYPFAGTEEAHPDALIAAGAEPHRAEVPPRERRCQKATLAAQYDAAGIKDGDRYMVLITHPDRIAARPYQGVDVARERSCG